MALTASESAAATSGGAAAGSLLSTPATPSSSVNNTIGESSSSGSRAISARGGEVRNASYDELIKLLTDDGFSKESAIKDSQAGIAELFKNYSNTDLPKIFSSQVSSGGYNSTGHQLIANDAFANTAAKGMALQSKTIMDYAAARRNQLDPLISLLNNDFETSNASYSYTLGSGSSTGGTAADDSNAKAAAAAAAAAVSYYGAS
jgi:hypothetical protein